MRKTILFVAIVTNYAGVTLPSLAQWRPTGGLLNVARTNQCSMTGGEVASARPDGIFFCPSRAAAVDAQVADASHFYFVQAYGSLAIHTTSKKLADCWAAHALATTPHGPHYVKQWIKHWRIYGNPDLIHGEREERISNVRRCCACGA
ncbi:hypothetical protein [Methylobacterium sp. PvR107]|uniref:hypothetical protein n=1 Tax=Methylobacterium sp. PvR107 TaxID=2806597 RepID=UPI001AE2FBAA|nr:hypothetical protein [Methylobacterium sp. PvR107]MBP1180357.1 hypothetical protein [Methylobacterium sp. PvR107]